MKAKKLFMVFFVVLTMILVLAGCRSSASATQQVVPGEFPDFVRDAIVNAPEDVLVGIGTANLASLSQSRTISTNRARAEIARQMNSMVDDMIRDYQASSEVDPQAVLSFQENITVTLARADVTGARVVGQDITQDQTVWTVVWLDRASVTRHISQAQAAARLAVPAMASFDAESRMIEAFARQISAEPQVRTAD